MLQLDQDLLMRARTPSRNAVAFEDCVAMNLFRRRGVKIRILCEVFKVARNTLYYRALTGDGDSYPTSERFKGAREVNDLIKRIGVAEAERRYVTDDQSRRVNAALEKTIARRKPIKRR